MTAGCLAVWSGGEKAGRKTIIEKEQPYGCPAQKETLTKMALLRWRIGQDGVHG